MEVLRNTTLSSRSLAVALALLAASAALPAAEEVRASHILVATKEEAQTIRQEIVTAGGDKKAFTAAARTHSKDVSTKVLGGDLGYFTAPAMEKPFSDAAFQMKAGEVSQPVQTSFGWHLIYITDRRDRSKEGAKDAPPPPVDPAKAAQNPQPVQPLDLKKAAPPVAPVPKDTPAPPPGLPPTPPGAEAAVKPPPAPPPEAKRRTLQEQSLRVSIETVKTSQLLPDQLSFPLEQAAEVSITLKNEGTKDLLVPAREILPLGLKLTPLGETAPLPGDWNAVKEPQPYFITLKPYEILGLEVSLNDYYKGLYNARLGLNWDANAFFANLDVRFPKAKESPEYATASQALKQRFVVRTDMVIRDVGPRIAFQRTRDLPVSIFESLQPGKKYYAQIRLAGEPTPIVIALATDKQALASKHFIMLALEGFYDRLSFFEVEDGDYVLGGCPTMTGTGAPAMRLPRARNDANLEHQRGTVSFVSRSIRSKGPVTGGEIGSIFMICLKPHPEWNTEHVPFGEVVSGLEVLEKQPRRTTFQDVIILTEEQYSSAGTAAATTPAAQMAGNPQAVIKTSKGALTVELFEDVARNTVANFITLAGNGFYAKQKFFYVMKDAGRRILAQTGSPSNDGEGGPGYYIADEPNAKKHVKGALVMVLARQSDSQPVYVPNSAGSMFFMCLSDIPAYDYNKFTVFGQVTAGLEVLDQLEENDVIESVEITKKKDRPYTVNKIPAP